jgi:tetratricopeptide (TPR) repeat protein
MDCDCGKTDRNELAEKYLNGQLDEAEQDTFETHILDCGKCLQTVELLQAVRFDLNERASVIRTQTSAVRGWPRWRWVAAACSFAIVASLGLLQFRQMHQTHSPSTAHTQPPAKQYSPQIASKSQPINGRKNIDFPLVNRIAIRPAPKSGLDIQGKRGGTSHMDPPSETTETAAHSDQSKPAISGSSETPAQVADSNPAGANSKLSTGQEKVAAAKTPASSSLLSDEGEKELFRLGAVRPAPYTFSGLSPHAGFGVPVDPSGANRGHVNSAPEKRPFFKDAMLAYLDKNYDDAAELLEKDLQVEPNAPDANFYLGVCKLLAGQPDESLAHLQIAAKSAPPSLAQQAHFYLAKAYVQTRDLASAEKELSAAAAIVGQFTASARGDLASVQALRAKENR